MVFPSYGRVAPSATNLMKGGPFMQFNLSNIDWITVLLATGYILIGVAKLAQGVSTLAKLFH